jgi:hypothetical protein
MLYNVTGVTFENVYADECAGNSHAAGGGEKVRICMYVCVYVCVYVYMNMIIYI